MTAPYKYPRAIEFVKELLKTISGKIKRRELRIMEFDKKKDVIENLKEKGLVAEVTFNNMDKINHAYNWA